MSQPEQAAQATDPFDPFGYWRTVRDGGIDAWSKTMREFVNSDAYSRASAEWLDTYLAMSQPFQRVIDETMSRTLSQCRIPSTADVERLAERLWNIELRIDDLDARLDEVLQMLRAAAEAQTGPVPQPPPADRGPAAEPGDAAARKSAPRAAEGLRPRDAQPHDGGTRSEPAATAEERPSSRARRGASRSETGADTHKKES